MKLLTVFRNLTSIALTACCVLGVSNARAQTATYGLTDLGSLPSGITPGAITPAGLNNQAEVQITGTSGTSAFRYTFSATPPMENAARNAPQSTSRGFGINYSGMVVGDSTFGKSAGPAQISRAAVFSNGTPTDLGTLQTAGPFSRANGINASGQVVGFSGNKLDGDASRAFLVRIFSGPNNMVDLGTLGGLYAQALAINDSGSVTGDSQIAGAGVAVPSHAFIWDSTTKMHDLGTLAGNSSYGTSINAQNHVVGYSTINKVDKRFHAFLHDGTRMTDLGSLGGASISTDRSYALGVNATDQVVGYSYLPVAGPNPNTNSTQVAFIYQTGLMVDLNDLIGTASENYRLYSATAINDRGQIIAVAFDTSANAFHAVLLTPVIGGIQ
jgi:probable HAF family extracellular repeat protein